MDVCHFHAVQDAWQIRDVAPLWADGYLPDPKFAKNMEKKEMENPTTSALADFRRTNDFSRATSLQIGY